MAESLDDGLFWLPPQFLSDDDVVVGNSNKENGYDASGMQSYYNKSLFPLEFPNGFGSFPFSSDLSSPVESVVGSTETESDEEDYLTGLTRQMARATLNDDLKGNDFTYGTEKVKGRVVFGSPQSTLCDVLSGCGCRKGSSHGSPKDALRVSSQPAAWDLLYAAAGEVARMQMDEAYGSNHGRGLLGPPRKPFPVSTPFKHSNPDGYYAHRSLSHKELQLLGHQSSQLWGEATGQHQAQALSVVNNGARSTIVNPFDLAPSAWPPQQALQQPQQGGSDMRAVFLGGTGAKRERAGTGVFLPRQAGTRPGNRKKSACSAVLVPARVAHALKLNLDEMGDGGSRSQYQGRFNGSFGTDGGFSDSLKRRSTYSGMSQQKPNIWAQSGMNPEIRLPREWNY